MEEEEEAGTSSCRVSQPSPVPTLIPPPGEERGVHCRKPKQSEEKLLLFNKKIKKPHQIHFGFV